MDYSALKTELTTDPKGLGYAASLASTNDVQTAALINAATGPGAAVVPLVSLSHGDFAMLIAPVVMGLSTATAALQAKWAPMLQLLGGVNTVNLTSEVMGMLDDLSTDFPTPFPASAVTAATTKEGSRAEVLWGAGTVISWQDVAIAMGRM